jgi:hypothetical protein
MKRSRWWKRSTSSSTKSKPSQTELSFRHRPAESSKRSSGTDEVANSGHAPGRLFGSWEALQQSSTADCRRHCHRPRRRRRSRGKLRLGQESSRIWLLSGRYKYFPFPGSSSPGQSGLTF